MIRDLSTSGNVERFADVLVVGAGTAGLLIACELARRGKRVVCLESGAREQAEDTHELNAVEQLGQTYSGAEHGRFRCLGGTSTRWGGALIPFLAADMVQGAWPVAWDDLAPYLTQLEQRFGLPGGSYDEPKVLGESDYLVRLAKWPSFGHRNVYSLLQTQTEAAEGPEVWINATATQFAVEAGSLKRVEAKAACGNRISVSASEVVIAAGAIETTRLALLLDAQNPGAISGQGLGHGFHDHLSAVVGQIIPNDRAALNRLVGFRFTSGGAMRNLRFELAPGSVLRDNLLPCFAHVGFSDTPGGFVALRDLFRAVQRRRLPALSVFLRLLGELPWLTKAVWWRFVERRLLYPSDASIELHMVIEQAVVPDNRIDLSPTKTDRFGQPLATINWQVRDADVSNMAKSVEAFTKAWRSSPLLSGLGQLRLRPMDAVASDMVAGGGIYHPGGSTRMAADPEAGPVDKDLRVFGLPNLTLCSTSVLPSGGGANPTMMMLLLAMRCVDRLTGIEHAADSS